MNFTPFNSDQARMLVDASHHYDQWLIAKRETAKYPGWMSWREKNGVDYLSSGAGNGKRNRSHGARSPETEAVLQQFQDGKANAKTLTEDIDTRLNERAPLLRAARLGRIPVPFAKVVRAFDVSGWLGVTLLVTGTHAIAAYEAMAGFFFSSDLAATEDLDFIWRHHEPMEVLVRSGNTGLLGHLKAIDHTYTVNPEKTFQVRNSKGLVIGFISDIENAEKTPKEYLKPIGIDGQEWILAHTPIETVCVDAHGYPVKLVVPDPRIFAVHKLWVSKNPKRNPLKATKDRKQAFAIAELVQLHLPQYPFDQVFIEGLAPTLREVFDAEIAPVLAGLTPTEPSGM